MRFWINAALWAIIIGVGIWKSKPQLLTIAFIISVYLGLETYFYVSEWLSYLPLGLHVLFYAIPVISFLMSSLVYCKKVKIDWEEAMSNSRCWYICIIIAVWMSFPTIFMFYDWHNAKMEYEAEMEELFGEEWEDEVEEMEQERFYRR